MMANISSEYIFCMMFREEEMCRQTYEDEHNLRLRATLEKLDSLAERLTQA
jgi:hypothetical protein